MHEDYHEVVIPIGFKTGQSGTYIITATSIANFIEDINIYLEDIKTGDFVSLYENTQYEFGYNPDENEHRFNLHFTEINYGIEDNIQSVFNIYSCNDVVYIKNMESRENVQVKISDITGRIVLEKDIQSTGTVAIPTNLKSGVYVVSLINGNKIETEKIIIN